MRQFAPVWLPDGQRLDGRASQTFLRSFNGCPRSAFLYQTSKGLVSTPEMERGKALHEVARRAVALCMELGEATIPPEVVKAILNEVLTEMAVPMEEHDYLREMSYRWASESAFDPAAVVALETLFVLDVDGFQVRCRIDLAQLLEDGGAVRVDDLKSSRAPVTMEDISRKRPDGTLAAKSMQLVLYALALAFGRPVRVEECSECNVWESPDGCEHCGGSGTVETVEPFPVASRAQRFDLAFVYPGIEIKTGPDAGKMLRREVSLTRLELDEYLESLRALVARVRKSEESGDWPAVASPEACSECAAPRLCPIPPEYRAYAGTVNDMEEASLLAEWLDRERAIVAATQKELRLWAKARGVSIPFGRDMEMAFVSSDYEEIRDKQVMFDAVERARQFGEPFDRSEHVRTRTKTDFKARKRETEGSDGEGERDGNGKRWGDVPY